MMKTYTKGGRKYVQSRRGDIYSYRSIVAILITTFVVSGILFTAGLVLIFSEFAQSGDLITLASIMLVKTIVGLTSCYVGYKLLELADRIKSKF